VGHSQHNGLLAAEKRCRDEKDYGGSQKGKNETVESKRTSGSRDNEDVSNTEVIGTRESRNINQEEGDESSSSTQSNSSSENVSNTNESLRRGGRTIPLGRENKVWRFCVEEEGIRDNIRIETVGRDAVSGEGEKENVTNTNDGRTEVSIKRRQSSVEMSGSDGEKRRDKHVLQSNNKRQQEFNISKESEKQNISDREYDTDEKKQTWWTSESAVCGIPNGISYELDKDRANRIKTLGNAIVPQIAREFGLAIKKVLSDS
jgi:hypothetical protein